MGISGKATNSIEVDKYFRIKPSDRSSWVDLESYVGGIRGKNKNAFFSYGNLKKCKFQYRGEICTIDKLENREAMNLEYPVFYETLTKEGRTIPLCRKDGYILCLFGTLDRYLMKARYETIEASIIIDVDYLNSDITPKKYAWKYFQRCFAAENAIYSYYATYEILALIIWIYKDYYPKNQDSSFEIICKKCRSNQVRERLSTDDIELFGLLAEKDKSIKKNFAKVTTWCNSFKHRGILRFDGEKIIELYSCVFAGVNNVETWSSNDWRYTYLDLDEEVIPALVQYHKDIMNAAKHLFQIYTKGE